MPGPRWQHLDRHRTRPRPVPGGKITTWHVHDGLPGEEVSALLFDRSGALWIALRNGLARFDGTHFTAWTRKNGLPEDAVSALAIAPDASAWAATAHGRLVRIQNDRLTVEPVQLPRNDVLAMHFDHDGNLWMGFQSAGLARLHNGALTLFDEHDGLPGQTVESMFEDAEHNLWVGLYDGGLVKLSDGLFTVIGQPEGVKGSLTSCAIADADGSIWAGNFRASSIASCPTATCASTPSATAFPARASIPCCLAATTPSGWATAMASSPAIAMAASPCSTIPRQRTPPSMVCSRIAMETSGSANTVPVLPVSATADSFMPPPRAPSRPSPSVLTAPSGSAPTATVSTATVNGAFTHFTTVQGLLSDHVDALLAGGDGSIWVGEASGGLDRIRDGRIVSYSPANGLFDSTAGDLVADRLGNLWMGSDRGIARVSFSDLDAFAAGKIGAIHSTAYDTSDGMRSRETIQGGTGEGTIAPHGRLLFPTLNGIAIVDPARALAPPPPTSCRALRALPLPAAPSLWSTESPPLTRWAAFDSASPPSLLSPPPASASVPGSEGYDRELIPVRLGKNRRVHRPPAGALPLRRRGGASQRRLGPALRCTKLHRPAPLVSRLVRVAGL